MQLPAKGYAAKHLDRSGEVLGVEFSRKDAERGGVRGWKGTGAPVPEPPSGLAEFDQFANPREKLVAAAVVEHSSSHAVHSVRFGDAGEKTREVPRRLGAVPLPCKKHDRPCLAFKACLLAIRVAGLGEDFEHGGNLSCLLQQGVVVPGS